MQGIEAKTIINIQHLKIICFLVFSTWLMNDRYVYCF